MLVPSGKGDDGLSIGRLVQPVHVPHISVINPGPKMRLFIKIPQISPIEDAERIPTP
jgi:hypothetical protein